MNNSNIFKNINTSTNKENNSNLNNMPSKKISNNNSFQKKYNSTKIEQINKASLIKKCHMKFSSLYMNPLSQSAYNNMNKIKVNKNNNKIFSPLTNIRNNNKLFNKNKEKDKDKHSSYRIKNLKNSILSSPNYFKDVNYIKYININVDIDKIKCIQLWWKYIHKIILIQKNIRSYMIKKDAKQKLKNYKFIISILRIFYAYFINNINICYKRNYLQKWKELSNKRNIFELLLSKKLSENEKQKFSINNSFQNKLIYDNKKIMTLGNIKNIVFNKSTCFKDKILSPYRLVGEPSRPSNIKINIKKSKNFACNIYSKDANNTLNKSLTNKSILNRQSSNRRSKSNNKVITHIDNQSFHFDEKTEVITNNLYKNIKEYYNFNEINVNPAISTINFYPSKLNKKNNKNNNQKKINKTKDTYNNNDYKFKKKTIISNKKNNKGNYNEFYKSNKIENWIPYQHTFGNLKTNESNIKNNYYKNKYNKITHTTVISPESNSNRNVKRNKNKSLEFDDNDINSIKFLLKFKRTFLHWKNIVIKQKLIKRLRLISKIRDIISVYKILYIKLFFSKMIQNIYKNAFHQNKINFNYILLNQYYIKLKEVSKKKKLINDMNIKLNKKTQIKEKNFKPIKKYENKNKKNNINFNTESNSASGLYYATQFNQKFNKLLNDKKGYKNNNIIIINNNINNNCQQLINNIKQNKEKPTNANYYYRKTVNNNSMIDMPATDISLNCTMDLYNQSDKSLNSILMNQMTEKQKNIINQKTKLNYLYNLIRIIYNILRKKVFKKYLNLWKFNVIMKKCSLPKNNMIDEKIIHFPKSPNPNINNFNLNNFRCNYMNNYNYTYNNTNINDISNNMNYTYNNNDLVISTMLTENNIKNSKKILYNNNNPTLLRNKIITPSNKFSFYTQYQNSESNNFNFINPLPSRETEPKIVYHKKLFPSFCSSNFKQNTNSLLIDYNYNNEERNTTNNISYNNNLNLNNIHYGKNTINNFYSSNNFFNQRNNYHLEKINKVLPEDKYGFKKINKIEEREISFSPSLSRKNHSFKNVIKDNYQNINNNNIYINVVENFRSDYQNQNEKINGNNIDNFEDMKKNNYQNNYYPVNKNLIEEDNIKKLMCHSHSQGFTKAIQRIFGNSS